MIRLLFPNKPYLQSLSYWPNIYSITSIDLVIEMLDQRLEDVPLPPNEIYEELSATSSENQVTVLLTDRIGNEWATLGMAGSIPCPTLPHHKALY